MKHIAQAAERVLFFRSSTGIQILVSGLIKPLGTQMVLRPWIDIASLSILPRGKILE